MGDDGISRYPYPRLRWWMDAKCREEKLQIHDGTDWQDVPVVVDGEEKPHREEDRDAVM